MTAASISRSISARMTSGVSTGSDIGADPRSVPAPFPPWNKVERERIRAEDMVGQRGYPRPPKVVVDGFEARDRQVSAVTVDNGKPRQPFGHRAWILIALAGPLLALNVWWLGGFYGWAIAGLPANDWSFLARLNPADPYAAISGFRWTVPAAYLWAGLVVPLGFGLWAILHVAAVAIIRPARAGLIVLVSFPFWHDLLSGNVLTFCFVTAWWAIRGNRAGVVAFCLLAVLVPRPLMIPVLAYLLLREPLARAVVPVAGIVVLASAVLTGQLGNWITLLTGSYGEMTAWWNLSPSRFLGYAWLAVAWPLAVLAFRRGYLGLASILVTPYLTPYYALFVLLDLPQAARVIRMKPGILVAAPPAPATAVAVPVLTAPRME